MRMLPLPWSLTLLLSLTALVHCSTLRQYSPDWLIPKPEPRLDDARRITAKSVFVAPSFDAQEHHKVRCAPSFTRDPSGRCVKLVRVDQAAQLDFLLQRLNAMYGGGASGLEYSETQPLQVAVGIPDEQVVPFEEMYSQVSPPAGEVSIDLLYNITEEPNKDSFDENTPDEAVSEIPLVPESESDVIVMPSKELFQIDEAPLVMLTEDDENSTALDANKNSNFEEMFPPEGNPERPLVIGLEDVGLMASVSKNESNVIKKATFQGGDSVQKISASEMDTELAAALMKNETLSVLTGNVKTVQSVNILVEDKQNSTLSENTMKDLDMSVEVMMNNKVEHEADVGNEVHAESSDRKNGTSFKVSDDVISAQASTSLMTSTEEAITETWTAFETTSSNTTSEEETTRKSKPRPTTTVLPTLTTKGDHHVPTEQTTTSATEGGVTFVDDLDREYLDGDVDEYPVRDVDLEVGYEDLEPDEEDVAASGDSKPTDGNAVASESSNVNDSVQTNASESAFDSGSGDGGISEQEHSGDTISFNQSVSLNSTKTVNRTEIDSSVKFPYSNGTTFEEVLGVLETENLRDKTLSHSFGLDPSHSDEVTFHEDVLETESSVHKVKVEGHSSSGKVESEQQVATTQQQVFTPQHSVQMVFPQPLLHVMHVNQGHKKDVIANNNEPKVELEEAVALNSPSVVQFHDSNQSPSPLHHNSHPLPQVPLSGMLPENPQGYNSFPYPYQHQVHNKPENRPSPYQQPFRPQSQQQPQNPHPPKHSQNPHPQQPFRPHTQQHTQNPHPHQHPQSPHTQQQPQNPHPQQQAGFVRFPVQDFHRSRPHPQVHGDAVRFPQEDLRTNDKYSRWGNWELDEGRGGVTPEQRHWPAADNRRNYMRRRPPQLAYY